MPDRVVWEWTDVAGGFIRGSNFIDAAANLAAVDVPLQACGNPQLIYATAGPIVTSPFAPGSGQYNLVTDLAVLTFATTTNGRIQVVVPGPLGSIFGSTSLVVDPTNPLVAALIAAVTSHVTDVAGNAVTAYISGIKSSRRTEQT